MDAKELYTSIGQYMQSNLLFAIVFIISLILLFVIAPAIYKTFKKPFNSKWQFFYFLVTATAIYLTIKLVSAISINLHSILYYFLMALMIRIIITGFRYISFKKLNLDKTSLIFFILDFFIIFVINLIFSDIGLTENVLVILFTAIFVRVGESFVNGGTEGKSEKEWKILQNVPSWVPKKMKRRRSNFVKGDHYLYKREGNIYFRKRI